VISKINSYSKVPCCIIWSLYGIEPPAGRQSAILMTYRTSGLSAIVRGMICLSPGLMTGCLDPAGANQAVRCPTDIVMNETFDTLSVSPDRIGPARWTAHTPWNGDFGDARFMDPGPDGPFSVSDGILSITARKDADGR